MACLRLGSLLGVLLSLASISLAFQSSVADTGAAIGPLAPQRQMASTTDIPPNVLRVDSSLVQVPVHVTTEAGTVVTNLGKESFQLFEDDIEQTIASLAVEDAPLSIGFLFDASASMKNKMEKASEAAAAFFRTANPEDEFFLVQFGGRVKLAVPFTPNWEDLYQRIVHTRPYGQTPLFDAVHLAIKEMKNARHARKALIILSDGGDNWSHLSFPALRNALSESDVQVYAMGVFDEDFTHSHPAEERRGPFILDQLALDTGGRHLPVAQLADLPAISARISAELRHEYLVGYYSNNARHDGKYRQIRVNVLTPNEGPRLRRYYRRGYYAPGD
jgi:Ca-activated chloride channel homolog